MTKKDLASQQMKKEFKKQMDLTKNIGQEEPAKPAKVQVKKAVKPEAKKETPKEEAPKQQAPKPTPAADTKKSHVQTKKEPETIDEGTTEKQWDVKKEEKQTEKKQEQPKLN